MDRALMLVDMVRRDIHIELYCIRSSYCCYDDNMLVDGLLGVLARPAAGCLCRPRPAEDCNPDSVSSLKATGAPRRSAQSSARTGIQYLCTVPGTSRVFFTSWLQPSTASELCVRLAILYFLTEHCLMYSCQKPYSPSTCSILAHNSQ